MNKEQLARKIALQLGKKRRETKPMVEAFCDTISETLLQKKNITLTGFGTFYVSPSKPFQTKDVHGRKMQVKDSLRVSFRAGRNLKKAINNQ